MDTTLMEVSSSILIYSPEAGIEPYARTLAVLGSASKSLGHTVYMTECTGQLIYCSMMAMYNIPPHRVEDEKPRLCAICAQKFSEVIQAYNFTPISFAQCSAKVPQTILDLCDDVNADLSLIEHKGFPVGVIATYDFSLMTKTFYSQNITAEQREIMSAYVKSTVLAYEIAAYIFVHYGVDATTFFNGYADHQAVRFLALQCKISVLETTLAPYRGACGNAILATTELMGRFSLDHCLAWPAYFGTSILPQAVHQCFDDVFFRSYGSNSHVFSTSKKDDAQALAKTLGLDLEKKICVVYTSSLDERLCFSTTLDIYDKSLDKVEAFTDQIQWIQELQAYSNTHDDVQFVVRIHPREGEKKRAGGIAEHIHLLRTAFPVDFNNFKIIWPDDPISSYDLMEMADIVLVAWSTMGVEAFRVGVPVLTWVANMYYVDSDCMRLATTPKTYFAALDTMLQEDPTFAQLREGIRYYHWRTFIPCIDVSETVKSDPYATSYWPKAPHHLQTTIHNIFQGTEDIVSHNVKKWQKALSTDAERQEHEAILEGIRALIHITFCPPCEKPIPLWFRAIRKGVRILTRKELVWQGKKRLGTVKDFLGLELVCLYAPQDLPVLKKASKRNRQCVYLIVDKIACIYIRDGAVTVRYSKLLARLAGYL